MRIEDIPWDSASCCGQHKSADIPLSSIRVLRIQHEPPNGYILAYVSDGLLDGPLIRGLTEEQLAEYVQDL